MEFVGLLMRQNFIMFLYLLIGYYLFFKKKVTVAGSADIGRVLLYIVMPATILKSYLIDFSYERLECLILSFMLSVLALLLSIAVSRMVFKKNKSIECFGAAFSNAGFIGIPLVQMTLGEEAVFYVASFVALLNIFQWTYGVWVLTEDRTVFSLKKIQTNPIVLSFLVGIILFLTPGSLPVILGNMVEVLASMNGPLAMIVLGTYLAQVEIKILFTEKKIYHCTILRLIAIPALTIVLMSLFPAKYHILKLAILIAASAPVGSNVAIFAQLYNQDYKQAVKEICMSTVCCIVTLPIVVGVANMFL